MFKGIAVTNAEGFDLAELNLVENIKHSYSTNTDTLSLTISELSTYKSLFAQIYKKRDIIQPFLSTDENFIDPLRTVLKYLTLDSSTGQLLEISDDVVKLNIPLSNKFYDLLIERHHTCQIRKCSESLIILPTYLLKEVDRVFFAD